MALNKNRLGLLITGKVALLSEIEKSNPIAVYTAIADALIIEISANLKAIPGSISSQGTGNLGAPVISSNISQGSFN